MPLLGLGFQSEQKLQVNFERHNRSQKSTVLPSCLGFYELPRETVVIHIYKEAEDCPFPSVLFILFA